MPRHRNRQSATHYLTVERDGEQEITCSVDDECPPGYHCENGICVDGYGDKPSGETTVLDDEPVEYEPETTAYIRTGSGERVQRAPKIGGRGALAELVQEGDALTLTPMADSGGGATLTNLEATGIDPEYGRRARVGRTAIELEQN
ncbi:dickkopf-related protein [Halococcus hamelinensis]|uniref:Uncharacterized protein n=1 Tax=Halococcus hamelinensis 100A6 TaxID=1132509 RepID=M0M248_9EURY|nr:dickkopf-related protein [Halococcus hamelinensis]EMA38470.1 hypothetical protein C447_09957 [Halococcus hamelinensis 100A6]